jgi:hypothetical protein
MTTEGGAEEDPAEAKMSFAADVVAHRVTQIMRKRNIKAADFESRIEIANEVLKDDPKLAEAYRDHAPNPAHEAA